MIIQILILDDSETDRDIIEMTLADNERYKITSFFDPATFKESLSDEVSLIITDVRIPGYDVFETISYIHEKFPGIYIIVMSGYFDDFIYERLFELDVDRVVKKGVGAAWVKKIAQYVNDFIPKIDYKKQLME